MDKLAKNKINDPFYSEKNQEELRRRVKDIETGKAKLSVHELIEVDDDQSAARDET